MDVSVFSTQPYDRCFLEAANAGRHRLTFYEARLKPETASLVHGSDAVCAFVNDDLRADVLHILATKGVRAIALRSAGFNHVSLPAAIAAGMAVGRVPAYSPHAVAEHTLALVLTLNRKTHRAFNRVREGNFAELDGLLGFDLCNRTFGIVGTGKIGSVVARIAQGFGCRVLAYDPYPNDACRALGVEYVSLESLLADSDIVTLHCPLTPSTHHMIDHAALAQMKGDAMLINTSRGGLIDTRAIITALKNGEVGSLGLDVYEEEADLFFQDFSDRIIPDDMFARLLTFPNVLITGHQAFFTHEALTAIAEITISNLTAFEETGAVLHPVTLEMVELG